MFQSRWLLIEGIVLLLGVSCLTAVTAQRGGGGGGMCPYAMSMSSQINVQMNMRPGFSQMNNQFQFNQHSFPPMNRSSMNMFSGQLPIGTQSSTCTGHTHSKSVSMHQPGFNTSTLTSSMQTGMTGQHMCSTSHSSMTHDPLVNYRSQMQVGTASKPFAVQPTFSKITSHTTIGLRFNTHTLTTTHSNQSPMFRPQVNLLTSSGELGLFSPQKMSGTRPQLTFASQAPVRAAGKTVTNLATTSKVRQCKPEMQVSVTTKASITCGRCHMNGTPQSTIARVTNPQQSIAMPVDPKRVVVPVALNQPPQVAVARVIPAVNRVPALDVVVGVPPLPPLQVFAVTQRTNPLVRSTALLSTLVPAPTQAVAIRPTDRSLAIGIEPPALPVGRATTEPTLYPTAAIIDRLPSAITFVVAAKPSSVSTAPVTLADIIGVPALPGNVTLPPLILEVPVRTDDPQLDTYREPPALPPDTGSGS